MRTLTAFAFALALSLTARAAEPPPPATAPAKARVAFKLLQETAIPGREPVKVTFCFSGDHAVMLNDDGDVCALYNVKEPAFYSHAREGMVPRRWAESWATGWRKDTEARLKGHANEAYLKALLRPEVSVSEREGTLVVATKPIQSEFTPLPDVDAEAAAAYAQVYALELYGTAIESGRAQSLFLGVEVAAVLGAKRVIPSRMVMRSTTPEESVTVVTTLRREKLTAADEANIRNAVKELDHPPKPEPGAK